MTRMLSLAAALAIAAALPARAEEPPLAAAVKAGDRGAVEALLAQRADPNAPLADTTTVLAWAVAHQDPQMVRVLLSAGANPNAVDQDGMTALMFACELSDPSIVGLLLDAKAEVRASRPDAISPLAVCAKSSSAAMVQRLIAAGAVVDAADANGQTPLMWAAAGGKLDNIATLLKAGARVNAASAKGFTPLFFAIKSGAPKAPEAILAAGGDLNHVAADGTTAIMLAVYQKNYPVAAMLAERGAGLDRWDENGNQPLHAAAIDNAVDFARVLLAKGANPNAITHPPIVNWQTEPNAGRNPPPKFVGAPPLLVAAQNGNAQIMKLLVANGAKADFKAADGSNVVLAAAVGGSVPALDYAIQLQPNLAVTTETGLTAMHLVLNNRKAQVRGHLSPETPDMVRLLAAKGASLTAKNDKGQSPADVIRRATPEVAMAFQEAAKAQGIELPAPAERRTQVAEAAPTPKKAR